jgi:hypothetical protein
VSACKPELDPQIKRAYPTRFWPIAQRPFAYRARGDYRLQNIESRLQQNLTKAVLSGAKVIERVLVDNLTETAAYKLKYDKLREYVFAGKRDQLWNVIPASIQTPQELQAFTERLQRNLTSRDRWVRYFSERSLAALIGGTMNDADYLSATRYSRSTRLTIPTFLAMKGARLPTVSAVLQYFCGKDFFQHVGVSPEVECIRKRKPRRPYEFGVKVSVAITVKHSAGGQFVSHSTQLERLDSHAEHCPVKSQCAKANERRIKPWEHEHVLEAVQQRLDKNPLAMRRGRRLDPLLTQSVRHRVEHGTICGRSCANSGHYKPLCACIDRTFVNPNSSRRRPEKI